MEKKKIRLYFDGQLYFFVIFLHGQHESNLVGEVKSNLDFDVQRL